MASLGFKDDLVCVVTSTCSRFRKPYKLYKDEFGIFMELIKPARTTNIYTVPFLAATPTSSVQKAYAPSFENSSTGYFAGSSSSFSSCFRLTDGEAVIARTVGKAINKAPPKSPQFIANCFKAGTFHQRFSKRGTIKAL
jgi:hypothetical protein